MPPAPQSPPCPPLQGSCSDHGSPFPLTVELTLGFPRWLGWGPPWPPRSDAVSVSFPIKGHVEEWSGCRVGLGAGQRGPPAPPSSAPRDLSLLWQGGPCGTPLNRLQSRVQTPAGAAGPGAWAGGAGPEGSGGEGLGAVGGHDRFPGYSHSPAWGACYPARPPARPPGPQLPPTTQVGPEPHARMAAHPDPSSRRLRLPPTGSLGAQGQRGPPRPGSELGVIR